MFQNRLWAMEFYNWETRNGKYMLSTIIFADGALGFNSDRYTPRYLRMIYTSYKNINLSYSSTLYEGSYQGHSHLKRLDFHTAALMFHTCHGIKARAHAHAEITQFSTWCIIRTWKALSLWPHAFQALMMHLIGKCAISTWPGFLL